MIEKAFREFSRQFAWDPRIEGRIPRAARFIVAGMGGSHLAADIIRAVAPEISVRVHKDYGLPHIAEGDRQDTCLIASSYSGNTEETIDAYETARAMGLPIIAITTGGELMARAKEDSVPYIALPEAGLQPRHALGYSIKAMALAMGDAELLAGLSSLAVTLPRHASEAEGAQLARDFGGSVPMIYASARNFAAAYIFKIKFNETGKIPAFMDVIPEANHNEMTGFDVAASTRDLSKKFHFLFLRDDADDPRIAKRFAICAKLYADRGFPVRELQMTGESRLERIFSALLAGDWASYEIARAYHLDPEPVPMVEEFKREMRT